ncbi:MAG: dehydrogenase [Prevotella sp.]
MADNYLERHYEEYEKKKENWIRRQRHLPPKKFKKEKPENESL